MTLASQYARAIYDARRVSKAGEKEFIARVMEGLTRRRHQKLLPAILGEYQELEAQEEKRGITLRIASEKDAAEAIEALGAAGTGLHPRMAIDPSLIQGFIIEGKDFRYDASAKRSLIELYKTLVTA